MIPVDTAFIFQILTAVAPLAGGSTGDAWKTVRVSRVRDVTPSIMDYQSIPRTCTHRLDCLTSTAV